MTQTRLTKFLVSGVLATALTGCVETTEPTTTLRPEVQPNMDRAAPGELPRTLRLAGDAGPVTTVSRKIQAEGINNAVVATDRETALRLVCSGRADVLVLSDSWSDEERTGCAAQNFSWSAASTESGYTVYADYYWSENLFRASDEI